LKSIIELEKIESSNPVNKITIGESLKDDVITKWIKQCGTNQNDFCSDMVIDKFGNIYIVGNITVEDTAFLNYSDAFITKYNSDGKQLWYKKIGTDEPDYIAGMCLDPKGNVYVTGYTVGVFEGNTKGGSEDAFIAKFTAEGVLEWIKQYGANCNVEGVGIIIDSSWNLYMVGKINGNFDPARTIIGWDVFLMKLYPNGIKQWVKQFGEDRPDIVKKACIDSKNNIYIAGEMENNIKNPKSWDIFIKKYDSRGEEMWSKQAGSNEPDYVHGMVLDKEDNVYIVGETFGKIGSNTNDTMFGDSHNAFIMKYNSKGKQEWEKQFGTQLLDCATDITISNLNKIYIAGYTEGSFEDINNKGVDIFLAEYSLNGEKVFIKQFGKRKNNEKAERIKISEFGDIYITGMTDGKFSGNDKYIGLDDIFLMKLSEATK
jgi:hypothetical protein